MTADPAIEMDTAVGDTVLVEGTLMSGRKTFSNPETGKTIDVLLVRIAGRKNPIAAPLDKVFRPSGERYVLTVTDFDPSLPKLAQNIRRFRHAANLTQYELAKAAGVGQQTVVNWETGKNGMWLRHADRVANVLNVSVSELLGG